MPIGIDAYGVYLPLYFYDVYLIKHAHLALSMHELGNIGPAFSHWGFNYPDFRNYTGIGLQHNQQWGKIQAKIEGGILLQYEINLTSAKIGLLNGRNIPYIRLHLGHKFGRFISTGIVFNWVPKSKHIAYVANYSSSPLDARGFTSWKNSPDHHESMNVFVGFSIK
ncbi:MAG: hypothetical protein R8P61_35570 [Bacteroidia bacterium]|nr:hypothetical protein [Bacteroidia bacterium]